MNALNGIARRRVMAAALIMAAAFSAAAAPTIGYAVAVGGGAGSLAPGAEFGEIALTTEFSRGSAPNPTFALRWTFPTNPFDLGVSHIGMEAGFVPFYLRGHPLAWMSPRPSVLAPLVSTSLWLPVSGPVTPSYGLSFQPFRLYTGDGYFSFAALKLDFNSSLEMEGWEFKLIEFSHLFFGRTR